MKIIGIVLTLLIYMLLSLSLLSGAWFIPKDLNGIRAVLFMLNVLIAGGISAKYAELFYKWFKSNLK